MKIIKTFLTLFTACLFQVSSAFAQLPEIGGEVWIEPGQTKEQIDTFFRIMKENKMTTARMFIMWNQIETDPGVFDFTPYDMAFEAAEKYNIKVVATLTAAEPAPCVNKRSNYQLHMHLIIEDRAEYPAAARYIKQVVDRYKKHPMLEYWWLLNEPGQYPVPSKLAVEEFRQWLKVKYAGDIRLLNKLWITYFPDFNSIEYSPVWDKVDGWSSQIAYYDWQKFWRPFLTQYMQWVSDEVKKHDDKHPITVNPHTVYDNLARYDFAEWRKFIDILGMSIHPSWALTDFQKHHYAYGIAGCCELMTGFHKDNNEIWVSEIQGGSNIFSGWAPGAPDKTDIEQWLWTSIGCNAKRVLYWSVNPRPQGNEAGEWALFGYGDKVSERVRMTTDVIDCLYKNKKVFSETKLMETPITIITTPESRFMFDCRGDWREFRNSKSYLKSYMAWYIMLMRLGLPVQILEAKDYNWDDADQGRVVIFPNTISVPSTLQDKIKGFVKRGNKLIADGLAFQFDEESRSYGVVGNPYEDMFGASLLDVMYQMDSDVKINFNDSDIVLSASDLRGELIPTTAQVLAGTKEMAYATRNKYGKGEAVWVPHVIGVREFNQHDSNYAKFVFSEVENVYNKHPFVLDNKDEDLMMQTLQADGKYVTIVINCSLKDVNSKIINRSAKQKAEVVWGSKSALGEGGSINLQPRETLVIIWE